jgi:hypothetical protein
MVMEGQLHACAAFTGKKLEIINFGVSGYGTTQELLTLRERVWDYAPDLVLLAMTTNNDITDNLRAFKKTDQIPYFVYRDGQLILDDSFVKRSPFACAIPSPVVPLKDQGSPARYSGFSSSPLRTEKLSRREKNARARAKSSRGSGDQFSGNELSGN